MQAHREAAQEAEAATGIPATFMLAQARYAFPVMPAVAVLLSAGLRALVPERWRSAALVVWVALLLSLTIYIYSAYVIPYWYLGEPR